MILANNATPMVNVTFDGVVVNNPAAGDAAEYHTCEGVASGVATGGTRPVPACFTEVDNH